MTALGPRLMSDTLKRATHSNTFAETTFTMREKAAILLLAGCRLALAQQQQLDPAAIAAFIVRRYPVEVLFCVFVMIYALNMLWGFQRNKKRVLEW